MIKLLDPDPTTIEDWEYIQWTFLITGSFSILTSAVLYRAYGLAVIGVIYNLLQFLVGKKVSKMKEERRDILNRVRFG